MDWAKDTYNTQYEKWVPWLEDLYLRWFTNDNKASYATKRLSSSLTRALVVCHADKRSQKTSERPKLRASTRSTISRTVRITSRPVKSARVVYCSP
jgi:hypothetical protein